VAAIKAGAPSAAVETTCDQHGGSVTVTLIPADGSKERPVVWSSAQRNLFRKYPDKRAKSIEEITAAVKKLAAKI
jgi:hypothetical protein